MLKKERINNEFMELVRIYSPSRGERQLADYLLNKIVELGYEAYEDEVMTSVARGNCGNVIVNIKGNTSGKRVMFSAHMDCVEPCRDVKPLIRDGVFYSDGTTVLGGDDKCAIAAMLEVLQLIKEQQLPHPDLQMVFTVAEEDGLEGARYINKAELRSDFGYVLDVNGAPGTIAIAAPGYYDIKTVIKGRKAHAGIDPENGINAITVAGKVLAQLPQGRLDEETTANVGLIKGGTARNIVADHVEIVSEARSIDDNKLEALCAQIVKISKEICKENGAHVEVKTDKLYYPVKLQETDEVVQIAKQAMLDLGLPVTITTTGGGSDANYFNRHGVPTAVLAIGMSKVHTTEEFLRVDDLHATALIMLSIIKNSLNKI